MKWINVIVGEELKSERTSVLVAILITVTKYSARSELREGGRTCLGSHFKGGGYHSWLGGNNQNSENQDGPTAVEVCGSMTQLSPVRKQGEMDSGA